MPHETSPAPRDDAAHAALTRLLGFLASDPANLALRADVFDRALALGEFALAQQQTIWVLSRTPVDFGWRHRLAMLDMARNEWAEAGLILQSLLDEGQTDPAITYNLAYVDFACGRFDAAASRLRPLLDSDGARLPDILPLLLRCLHRLGALDEALALFEPQIAAAPAPEAFGVASLLAIDAGRVDLAKGWAAHALRSAPAQHEALVARATLALGERDAPAALRDLEAARQRHPDDGRTLSAIGMAHLLELELGAAHVAFTQAVRQMPAHIGTWHGLGWCELLRKDLPAARAAFDAALALDATFGESHGGLAVVQALAGQAAQADTSIRRALKLDPAGLSARFAQAVRSGEAADPQRFTRLARRVLGQRRTADGQSLADVVLSRPR
jgi:tetratricopeptide (TPR) repeat protein